MRQDKGDFTFALAVSSHTKFEGQSAESFKQHGSFLMQYKITGGDEDGKKFPISMSPCDEKDYSDFGKHYIESKNKVIQAHIAEKQFYCPDAFDLTMWGEKTDLNSKIITIAIAPCDPKIFS